MAQRLDEQFTWPEIVEKILLETGQESNTKFKEWLISKENIKYQLGEGHEWQYLYNVYHKTNFTDADQLEAVCGKEGAGKSTVAIKKAAIVDPTFCKERIFNDRLKLIQWLRKNHNNTRGKAIIMDEGNLMIFSRESMSVGNINVIKMLTLCRQANLYILVCIPYFQTIDSYIRQHRIDALTLIKKKRTDFVHYSKEGVEIIDECLRQKIPINKIRVPEQYFYYGHWNKDLPKINDITESDYRKLKDDNWVAFLEETEANLNDGIDSEKYVSTINAMKLIKGITRHNLVRKLKSGELKGKKIGDRYYFDKDSLLQEKPIASAGTPVILLKDAKKDEIV